MRQSTLKDPTAGAWRRPLIWLLVLSPFIAVLLTVGVLSVTQPGCESCHKRDARFAAATSKASHSEVKCVACHVPPAPVDRAAFGFRQLFGMLIPVMSAQGRDWETVDDQQCLACHKSIGEQVVSAKGLRIDHQACASGRQCVDCHSSVAHGATRWVRGYDMEACLECHVAKSAPTACDTCHVERDRADRISTGSFAITHGPQWRKTHGMGNMANCAVCHTAAKCETCHGVGLPHDKEFIQQHGAVSRNPAAKCESCHEQRFCDSCHGLQMPHTRAFTRDHAVQAKANRALCNRCHADPDCTECHVKHVHPGGAVGGISASPSSASGKGGE